MFQITEVVKNLLIINVLTFLASIVLTQSGILNTQDMLALHYPTSPSFRPYQIATYFFMHANFLHLLFNMIALVFFGNQLEVLWGAKRFLFYYIFCAMGALVLHLLFNYVELHPLQVALDNFRDTPSLDNFWAFFNQTNLTQIPENAKIFKEMSNQIREGNPQVIAQVYSEMVSVFGAKSNTAMLGASGAVFGILLAFGIKFPESSIFLLFIPIPIKAKYFVPVLMIGELYLGVNQFSWDNIAHFAHLGGAIFGILLILYWEKFGSRF
ncbi:MAG: rhomboid family intramembrane serine protease [Saprospiraceae bacterium]|nr:MAG: rhomboid family intramembrane serine protease [Saprospiraceae bacterium]